MTDYGIQPGPCIGCGLRNYSLSFGGPLLCPACDCGNTGPAIVRRQAERIRELEKELSARTEVVPIHEQLRMAMDSKEFYELSQIYRHADLMDPVEVSRAWKALKDYIIANSREPESPQRAKT